jgi:hypothetical protein
VVMSVAVETETTDPCQLDGSLWDAAARQVHLDDSAVHGAQSSLVGRSARLPYAGTAASTHARPGITRS